MFEDYTAADLADELDQVKHYDPYYTGPLSMLDEATLRWTVRHPGLSTRQNAFASARHLHKRSSKPEQGWASVVTAAEALAVALRPYGDEQLQFCGARSVYGTCRGQVHDGPCPRSDSHVED